MFFGQTMDGMDRMDDMDLRGLISARPGVSARVYPRPVKTVRIVANSTQMSVVKDSVLM